MVRRKNIKNRMLKRGLTRKSVLTVLVPVLLIASAGSYATYRAQAACNPGSPGTINVSQCPTTQHNYQDGNSFSITTTGYVPDPRVGQYPAPNVYLKIEFLAANASNPYAGRDPDYLGYTCAGAGVTCSARSPERSGYLALCLDFDPSLFGRSSTPLLTTTYKSNFYGRWWIGLDYSWHAGTCSQPFQGYTTYPGSGGSSGTTLGECGTPDDACTGGGGGGGSDGGNPGGNGGQGQGSGGGGTGTRGSGTGSQGSGSGKTGTGTGGGSSGSTATKQGNKPNSTPSSSSQGNKTQTKLQPSPFYDGKQYQQGSESDSGFGGLFNKPTSGGIAKGWYLLTALILLAGGGGVWYYLRKKKQV